MKFGYVRVSTPEQKIDLQMDALLKEGVDPKNIYADVSSGAKKERKEFNKLQVKLRKGDQVIVWKLDRIARSVKHISTLMEEWEKLGVEFRSIQEPFLDTTSSHGKFIFTLFSAVAQLERDLIIERTKAGLAAAALRGRKGGRPSGLSREAKRKAKLCAELYKGNTMSVEHIMDTLGIGSKSTFYRYLKFEGVNLDDYVPRKKKTKRRKR